MRNLSPTLHLTYLNHLDVGRHDERGQRRGEPQAHAVAARVVVVLHAVRHPGGNCIKMGLPGKLILRDYFQENRGDS